MSGSALQAPQPAERIRLHFLDGLRGWGAIIVVLYHLFVEIYPMTPKTGWVMFHLFPFNGGLAVFVFFIVSGYALSIGYLQTGNRRLLDRMIVGRYFRLMTPILLGCLIVYGLAVSGLVQNPMRRAAASDLVTVVRFGLYRFLNAFTDPATVPIPQLWTMPYEAEGSIFALGVLWVAGTSRLRFGAYIAALVFGHPMFASFAVGMFLAELSRVPMTPASRRVVSIAATCLLVPSLALVALLPGSTEFRVMWVSSMVAACAVFSDTAKSFLSNGISTRLAQISFPLYILHGAVIFSLGTFLHRFARTPCAILAVNVITGIGAAAFAFAFRWIDTAGIAIARSLGRLLPRERHLDPRPVSAV